jgi:hypothetical protein
MHHRPDSTWRPGTAAALIACLSVLATAGWAADTVVPGEIAQWEAIGTTVTATDDGGIKVVGTGMAILREPILDNDYRLDLRASLAAGNGYGICVAVGKNEAGQAIGQGFQYDPGAQGFRLVDLLTDKDLAPPVKVATDNLPHTVALMVTDGQLRVDVDGVEVFRHDFPDPPPGSVAVRVWDNAEMHLHALDIRRRRR